MCTLKKNEDKLIDVLQMDNIQIKDVISTLKERLEEENEARLKALARAKGKEKVKEKRKSVDTGDQGNYIPAQEVSHTRDNVRSLHKIIVKNWVTHSTEEGHLQHHHLQHLPGLLHSSLGSTKAESADGIHEPKSSQ